MKTIWIFWEQGIDQAPPLVKLCVKSWQKFNPDYKIVVLDRNTVNEYIIFPEEIIVERPDITVQKISAISRLLLLSKYGGVWTDATVFCSKPLRVWLPSYLQNGFFAFSNPGPDRLMSNWFIAAERENWLLSRLTRDFIDFFRLNRFENQDTAFGNQAITQLRSYLSANPERTLLWISEIITKGLKIYPYPIFHYIFNKLVLTDETCRKIWYSAPHFEADYPHFLQILHEKASGVPFPYHSNFCESARILAEKAPGEPLAEAIKFIAENQCPMYKLTWRPDFSQGYWKGVLDYLSLKL